MVTWLTSGESHGKALTGILDGMPAGLGLTTDPIQHQLFRRQQGYGRGGRMKIESDTVEILSGVRFGQTMGSPIALLVQNNDWKNWSDKMKIEPLTSDEAIAKVTLPRPGHADLAGVQKFQFDDIRPVIERSSARETTMRVALGTIARVLLEACGIHITSHILQIGGVRLPESVRAEVSSLIAAEITQRNDASEVRCVDASTSDHMIEAIRAAQKEGNSLGGIFEVLVDGVPPGIGSYVQWNRRLDAILAQHVCSIQAIKGVEIGDAFDSAARKGSEVHDEILYDSKQGYHRKTNHAGGIEGGMSNGERIVIRAAMKPIPTLARPLQSVDIQTKAAESAHKERTDSCSVPAAAVVGEAMTALALINPFLEKVGGDSMAEILDRVKLLRS